jgi:hypothetical protein
MRERIVAGKKIKKKQSFHSRLVLLKICFVSVRHDWNTTLLLYISRSWDQSLYHQTKLDWGYITGTGNGFFL